MIFNPSYGGSSSGGGGSVEEPLDPMVVYKETRPADWLPMPEPKEDEMYMLVHIPDGGSSYLAFSVTCEGQYTVETGTVEDGAFSAIGQSANLDSASVYEAEYSSRDFGNITSDGMKQVMVKVSGASISKFAYTDHSKVYTKSPYHVVEISCRLPVVSSIQNGSYLRGLTYFSAFGENNITSGISMFQYCHSLKAILSLDTSKFTSMSGMFLMCHLLVAIPKLNASNVTNMNNMFNSCYSIKAIPEMDTSNVNTMQAMFYNCHSLTRIPKLSTDKVTDMSNIFGYCTSIKTIPEIGTGSASNMRSMFSCCYSLRTIPTLDTSKATNIDNMFNDCFSLLRIPQLDITSAIGASGSSSLDIRSCNSLGYVKIITSNGAAVSKYFTVYLSYAPLSRDALVSLFEGLPVSTRDNSLSLSGVPGYEELTDEEKAIATNKGWRLSA